MNTGGSIPKIQEILSNVWGPLLYICRQIIIYIRHSLYLFKMHMRINYLIYQLIK